jgi:hypothetical protein
VGIFEGFKGFVFRELMGLREQVFLNA